MSRVVAVTGTRAGRPRDPRAHAAILAAVRDLLTTVGYERLTIEAVAAKAHVGKQTVYRWWPAKSALVAEAALAGYLAMPRTDSDPTGDLVADVRAWIVDAYGRLADPATVALIRGLAAAAADRDSDADLLYAQITRPSRDQLVTRLAAGVTHGQVDPATDLGVVADTLAGAVLYRVLARRPPPTADDVENLVTLVTAGVGRRTPGGAAHAGDTGR